MVRGGNQVKEAPKSCGVAQNVRITLLIGLHPENDVW